MYNTVNYNAGNELAVRLSQSGPKKLLKSQYFVLMEVGNFLFISASKLLKLYLHTFIAVVRNIVILLVKCTRSNKYSSWEILHIPNEIN